MFIMAGLLNFRAMNDAYRNPPLSPMLAITSSLSELHIIGELQ